jgi:hypothetical protein
MSAASPAANGLTVTVIGLPSGQNSWIARHASFETAASRPPQDDGKL